MKHTRAATFLIITLLPLAIAQLGCRDENNTIVDWFYVYKLPQDPPNQWVAKSDGSRYIYRTSNSKSWTISTISVKSPSSVFGLTLGQIYNPRAVAAILYNDEAPDAGSNDNSKGISKGVAATDWEQGFWLAHSIPTFPPALSTGRYDFPDVALNFGHSALCLTIDIFEIDKVAQQLIMNHVKVFSTNMPTKLRASLPNLSKLVDNINILTVKTVGGATFTSFAKSGDWRKELYLDLVATTLKSDFAVQSTRADPTFIPTNCTNTPKVTTISRIDIHEAMNYGFSTDHDHSKWAVSTSPDTYWICMGDSNRQADDIQRGGGAICQNSKQMADFYRGAISEIDPCLT